MGVPQPHAGVLWGHQKTQEEVKRGDCRIIWTKERGGSGTMKKLLVVLTSGALLCVFSVSAYAFAIYNHIGHDLCVADKFKKGFGDCNIMVRSNGTYNGAHGTGLNNVWFIYEEGKDGTTCYGTTVPADIPDGGFASATSDTVTVYRHCDNCTERDIVGGYPFEKGQCGGW